MKTQLLNAVLCSSLLLGLTACDSSSGNKKNKVVSVKNAHWCSDQLTVDGSWMVSSFIQLSEAESRNDQVAQYNALKLIRSHCQILLRDYKSSEFECKMTVQGKTDVLRYDDVVKVCQETEERLGNTDQSLPGSSSSQTPTQPNVPPVKPQQPEETRGAECKRDLQSSINDFYTAFRRYESAKRANEYYLKSYRDDAGRKCNRILKDYSPFDFGCSMQMGNSKVKVEYYDFRQLCDGLFG